MAMATSTAIALALAAASAGAQYYNTKKTEGRQDAQAAAGIRQQGEKQKQADAKVAAEVERMKASTAEDERARSLSQFMDTLRRSKGQAEVGGVGGEAYREAANEATTGVADYGSRMAGLLSRIDAPTAQRQGEAFGYGRLGTDLDLIGREAAGDNFINELRLRGIRRNAGIDLAAGLLAAGSGAVGGGAASAGSVGTNALGASRGSTTKTYSGYKNYGGGP